MSHLSPEMVTAAVRDQYDAYPYPQRPLLAKLQARDTYPLQQEALQFSAFGEAIALERPRILVAGCGSFEPCAVALANPNAKILAIDLSRESLQRLKIHCLRHGLGRQIEIVQGDFRTKLESREEPFDLIVATGVVHHLSDPEAGLRLLAQKLSPRGVMRLMLYSRHGRRAVQKIRDLVDALEIRTPIELKSFVDSLPANHPIRLHFHLYGDSKSNAGIMDGFLHACEHGYDALELRELVSSAGLRLGSFLHPTGGQPQSLERLLLGREKDYPALATLDAWERVAILDRLLELETNFFFTAVGADAPERSQADGVLALNPVLENWSRSLGFRMGSRSVYSRRLRTEVHYSELEAAIQGKSEPNQIQAYLDDLLLLRRPC